MFPNGYLRLEKVIPTLDGFIGPGFNFLVNQVMKFATSVRRLKTIGGDL